MTTPSERAKLAAQRILEFDEPLAEALDAFAAEAVRAALEQYGSHDPDCKGKNSQACSCGFSDTLRARTPASVEEKPESQRPSPRGRFQDGEPI